MMLDWLHSILSGKEISHPICVLCRAGHLDPQKAIDLGVRQGAAFTQLKDGFSVVGVGE